MTTVGDGSDYRDASLVYPIAAHPRAPATAEALSGALRLAYVAAQHSGQALFTTVYPIDFSRPASDRAMPDGMVCTSYTRIGQGYRHLAPGWTHAVAEVAVGLVGQVFGTPGDATLSAQLTVTNGAGTTNGLARSVTVPYQLFTMDGRRPIPRGSQEIGWVGPAMRPTLTPRRVLCDVELATVQGDSAPVQVLAYVSVKALTGSGSGSVAVVPIAVSAWLEVRG